MKVLTNLAAGVAAAVVPQATDPMAYDFDVDLLGARGSFVITAFNGAHTLAAIEAAKLEIARLNKVFNSRSPDAELYRYNRLATLLPSPELAEVLLAAEAVQQASGGAFHMRPDGGRITLDGIAKGYIVDKALTAGLQAAPVQGMLVNIGGDIACKGVAPEGGWIVGLPDPAMPYDNAPLAAEVRVSAAIATTGLGARGWQTIDPATGRKADRNLAATVLAPTAMLADAMATALHVLDPAEGLELAARQGVEARITDREGRVHQTAGFIQNTLPPKREAAKPWGNWQALNTFTAPRRTLERDPDFRSPYVAMWVTDKQNRPIRTLILVGRRPEWQRDNYIWWAMYKERTTRLIEVRSMGTSQSGVYNVFWDGVDDAGRPVPLGEYVVHVETSRERGKHTYRSMPVTYGAKPFKASLPKTEEGGGINISFDRY